MLEIALGSAMMYYFATEAFDIKKKPASKTKDQDKIPPKETTKELKSKK